MVMELNEISISNNLDYVGGEVLNIFISGENIFFMYVNINVIVVICIRFMML